MIFFISRSETDLAIMLRFLYSTIERQGHFRLTICAQGINGIEL